jgi:hypothetical protein
MLGQAIRWILSAAVVLTLLVAVFVAWWLALAIMLGLLVLAALRQILQRKDAQNLAGGSVIVEGEFSRVAQADSSATGNDSAGQAEEREHE